MRFRPFHWTLPVAGRPRCHRLTRKEESDGQHGQWVDRPLGNEESWGAVGPGGFQPGNPSEGRVRARIYGAMPTILRQIVGRLEGLGSVEADAGLVEFSPRHDRVITLPLRRN